MQKSMLMAASLLTLFLGPAYALDQDTAPQVFSPVANLVDETIPPAACTKCEPHVARIRELQRLRRHAHDRLKFFQQRGIELQRQMATERDFVVGMGLVMEIGDLERAINDYTTQIGQALKDLAGCNAACGERPPPGGTGTTGTTGTTGITATPATVEQCPDCARIMEDLQAAEARRARDAEALEHYQREQQQKSEQRAANERALRELRRNNQGNSAEARRLEDDIRFSDIEGRGLGSALDDLYIRELQRRVAAAEAEIARLKQKLEDCRKYCQPKKTSGVFRSPLPYAIGAGVMALAAFAGGSGDSTALTSAVPPQPTNVASPATPTQPQPPAEQPTIAGVADCTACAPIDDPGGHNRVINLCPQLTGEFGITVASITIRHRPPFVDIVGAQFDTTSGAFRGSGRGTVAGMPNVGVVADGTANAQTGAIVFTYTMGTGGELPGGRPITYRITLQKRR